MDEFSLIDVFFKTIPHQQDHVIIGIGDDAACLSVPKGMHLLVSSDTLVSDVHFKPSWSAYDIAYRAVMVNVSDIAAMGGQPCWITLALTVPTVDEQWLKLFSQGLKDSLDRYNMALIGGDTTRGPLCITITVHGFVPKGRAIRRDGASSGDIIYVSGELGAAALALDFLDGQPIDETDKALLMKKLLRPEPRIDLVDCLQAFATAAIDISDGLSADLNHLCVASRLGALLSLDQIPVHPLLKKYRNNNALDIALSGGDDYELCFSVSPEHEEPLLKSLAQSGVTCYPIGVFEKGQAMRVKQFNGEIIPLEARGYRHF